MQPIETCTHAWNERSLCIGSSAAKSRSSRPKRPRATPPTRAEPLAEMRDRTRPERDVDRRIELEDAVALRLGVAPADGDHPIGLLTLSRGRLTHVRRELRVRLLADGARVEDDDVGLVGRRGLTQSELLEHPLDPLAVVSVHLATKGRDVVPAHGCTGYRAVSARFRPGRWRRRLNRLPIELGR